MNKNVNLKWYPVPIYISISVCCIWPELVQGNHEGLHPNTKTWYYWLHLLLFFLDSHFFSLSSWRLSFYTNAWVFLRSMSHKPILRLIIFTYQHSIQFDLNCVISGSVNPFLVINRCFVSWQLQRFCTQTIKPNSVSRYGWYMSDFRLSRNHTSL